MDTFRSLPNSFDRPGYVIADANYDPILNQLLLIQEEVLVDNSENVAGIQN